MKRAERLLSEDCRQERTVGNRPRSGRRAAPVIGCDRPRLITIAAFRVEVGANNLEVANLPLEHSIEGADAIE